MAFLSETDTWEAGVYQLETTDPVEGGPAGKDNVAPRQLANRTLHLKNLVDALGTGKLNLSALASQVQAVAGTDNATWMTPLRVAQAITALATIAAASETVSGKVELATVAETITGTDTARATHPAGVKAAIAASVAALVDASPTTLDTLNELAAALADDPNFATTMTTALATKAPLASPTFTGTPMAPNPATGTRTAQLATMQKFADEFGKLLADTGWQKLPSGLIIQWGAVTISAGPNVPQAFSLPIAFPNAGLKAVASSASAASFAGASYLSTTQITLFASNNTAGVTWVAIGY